MRPEEISYFVPTRGRMHLPPTTLLELEPIDLLPRTTLCCPMWEMSYWGNLFPKDITIIPDPYDVVDSMCDKRPWMLEQCKTKYIFMIDDDVTFGLQYDDRSTSPVKQHLSQFKEDMTEHIWDMFQEYDTVILGSREYSNTRPMLLENHHGMRAWGYDLEKVLPVLRPTYGRNRFHVDTDWTITLLEAGHGNVVTSYIIVSGRPDAKAAEDGGFGRYRTDGGMHEAKMQLLRDHPDTIIVKPDGTRRINWKRFKDESWKEICKQNS